MATYSRTHSSVTVAAGEIISATHMNDEFDIIFNALDTGGIGSTQIATSAITSSELAADAVTLVKLDNTMIIKSDEPWADTNDTKIPTVKAVIDALTAGTYEEDLSATSEASIFGSWTNLDSEGSALIKAEVYQVESDGYITVHAKPSGGNKYLDGLTDDLNPPTTHRQRTEVEFAETFRLSISFPVRKDDYFKISVSEGTPTIYWLPIGLGECVIQ